MANQLSVTELLNQKILAVAILAIPDLENVTLSEKPMLVDMELNFLLYEGDEEDVSAALVNFPEIIQVLVKEYRRTAEGQDLRGKILCLLQKLTA